MLSIHGTIQNTGVPAVTVAGHNGGFKQGKTGVRSLKVSRESDSLIVVLKPAKTICRVGGAKGRAGQGTRIRETK